MYLTVLARDQKLEMDPDDRDPNSSLIDNALSHITGVFHNHYHQKKNAELQPGPDGDSEGDDEGNDEDGEGEGEDEVTSMTTVGLTAGMATTRAIYLINVLGHVTWLWTLK
ncbi:hypothetical protein CF327_g5281 [Tilletia walkeri]|nr:hypothetical protein CF327_g5281 [Tilletia walkeri]